MTQERDLEESIELQGEYQKWKLGHIGLNCRLATEKASVYDRYRFAFLKGSRGLCSLTHLGIVVRQCYEHSRIA